MSGDRKRHEPLSEEEYLRLCRPGGNNESGTWPSDEEMERRYGPGWDRWPRSGKAASGNGQSARSSEANGVRMGPSRDRTGNAPERSS
jgi:hypothetical protein